MSVGLSGPAAAGEAGVTAAAAAVATRSLLQQNSTGSGNPQIIAGGALDEELTQLCEWKGGGGWPA